MGLPFDANAVAGVFIGPAIWRRATENGTLRELDFDMGGDDVDHAIVVPVLDHRAGRYDDVAGLGHRHIIRCHSQLRDLLGTDCRNRQQQEHARGQGAGPPENRMRTIHECALFTAG